MMGQSIRTNRYTRLYIAVPDTDAEEVRALGAIKVAPEDMNKHQMLRGVRLKPGVSAWYYVDQDPSLFVKWPFITFELVIEHNDVTNDYLDVTSMIDDD